MDVKVVDNFLDPIDLKKVSKKVDGKGLNGCQWTIQVSATDLTGHEQQFLELIVSDEEFFNTYLFNLIKKHLDGEYEIERIYFNGQWSGREGSFHSDNCDVTVLFYVSPYEYGWGGFTEIMTSVSQPTIIHPLQNRLLIFPGKILHKGYSFSYQKCPMRISLAFKLNTK